MLKKSKFIKLPEFFDYDTSNHRIIHGHAKNSNYISLWLLTWCTGYQRLKQCVDRLQYQTVLGSTQELIVSVVQFYLYDHMPPCLERNHKLKDSLTPGFLIFFFSSVFKVPSTKLEMDPGVSITLSSWMFLQILMPSKQEDKSGSPYLSLTNNFLCEQYQRQTRSDLGNNCILFE